MKFEINKSSVTNGAGVLVCLLAFLIPSYFDMLWSIGSYAVSGSITNWVALYMLFEKVPFCYGSGVIPNRFEDFRKGIRELVLEEFFTVEKLKRFLGANHLNVSEATNSQVNDAISGLNYDTIYESLVETITKSQFGAMLGMMGGAQALEPLREPIKDRIKLTVKEIAGSGLNYFDAESIRSKIENVVDARLEELTPKAVKEIMEKMIREHLGWLVVWGGVLGGLIGFIAALF